MRYLSCDLGFHGHNCRFLCLFLFCNARRAEERFHFDVQLPPWIRTESIVRKKIVLNDSKGFMTIQSFLGKTTLHVSSHSALKRSEQLLHISIPFLFQFGELRVSYIQEIGYQSGSEEHFCTAHLVHTSIEIKTRQNHLCGITTLNEPSWESRSKQLVSLS